ncbi:quaternary amine ABC transporter ATP-binding protein [Allomesorhizobium camelthorni]|uniref:Quaternary amine transport ATP-binding protein n=1 Tax=Allomesorhizobium camelthorni TaxID=475069 RepID=A0A6G4WLW4_9HYPH|nr:betaine/proline/choline family ABC transporter ATP-binding protein [Mesorhizobium camelthorni]NGO55348.1 betaine/proline/choline family ABC transporter ATP-binding protein [Mesorhizobium camelthorni]
MEWHIECEGVWKIFGPDGKTALQAIRNQALDKNSTKHRLNHIVGVADVSLKIRRGELFCIMGLSGSGKSTLLRHINRLIEPTAGRISVGGADTADMDKKALSRLRSKTIGMVFQHMALWPHRSLQDNVAYGLEIQGIAKKERRRIAAEMLAMMKLDGWEEHYPDELSGGMQQRVGLARALASDPDILLMDEPFSALDPLIRRDLQTQFLDLSQRLHKTTLFVTHDLDEAIRLGDRIAIMRDGEIVQVGTREDIILNPANDYVADFVRPLARSQFLKADAVMNSLTETELATNRRPEHCVPWDASLQHVIEKIAAVRQPIGVVRDDAIVGLIDPYTLLGALRTAEPIA